MKLEFMCGESLGPHGVLIRDSKTKEVIDGIECATLTFDAAGRDGRGSRTLTLTLTDFDILSETRLSSAFVRGYTTREMQ